MLLRVSAPRWRVFFRMGDFVTRAINCHAMDSLTATDRQSAKFPEFIQHFRHGVPCAEEPERELSYDLTRTSDEGPFS